MLWNFTQWLNWLWTDACKHAQMRVCGYRHSSPYSLLWLSCARYQLIAAFTLFLLLEVSHISAKSTPQGKSTGRGYPDWCRNTLARPCLPGSDFCCGRRQDGHKDAKGSLEGRAGFSGIPSDLFRQNVVFCGPCNCTVCGQKMFCKYYVQFSSPPEISWPFFIASVCFLFTVIEKSLIPSWYTWS